MNPFKYIFAVLALVALSISSCSEDINLVGDFKETAVIVGLLDQQDTLHYVKITRAFIGPGNSLQIAQIPDSSYFQQVDATIKETKNGTVYREWTLQDTIIQNKDENGVFYAPEQKVYYFKTSSSAPLDASMTYKLHVTVNGGEFTVDGETKLVNGVIATAVDLQNFQFKFADNPGSYIPTGVAVAKGNSRVINTKLKVNFYERVAGAYTLKSFVWNLGETETVDGSPSVSFTANGKIFFELLRDNTTNNTAIDQRRFHSIEVTCTGGSDDLYNYMTVNQPSSSLAQSKPTFTNLVASNGRVIGIFSSRQTYKKEKFFVNPDNQNVRMLSGKTTIELCNGPITGTYLFCSQHPGDLASSIACQ
jgi:hypothetical protein